MSVTTRPPFVAFFLALALLGDVATAQDTAVGNQATERQSLLSVELSKSHLGYTYVGNDGIRFFVTQIELTNHSGRNVSIPVPGIKLLVDGVPFRPEMKPLKLKGYHFRVDGKSYRFRDLPITPLLPLSEGTTGTAWLIYSGLPKGGVPQLELQLDVAGVLHKIDVNAYYAARLELQMERIGPADALGLLTVDGALNTINVATLVDSVDQLAAAGVSRVVLTFADDASEVDDPLQGWVKQTAEGRQTSRTYAQFPAIVSTIREFHVAAIPGDSSTSSSGHLHQTSAAAVEAALATAYRGLSADEIAHLIERGHPLVQASALVSGGSRLSPEYLPLLLDRTESEHRLLRRGALVALSGFGDQAAIDALTKAARSADPQLARLAVECLAASRYRAAHEALGQLLEEGVGVSKTHLITVFARYPRPQWSQQLTKYALNADGSTDWSDRRMAVLALGEIGHPQLTDILEKALAAENKTLRQAAFGQLLSRGDHRSEQIALEHALTLLEESPPTSQMLQLFDRVRDPRIVPLLIPYLDETKQDRAGLISTLARIGPTGIDDVLAERFDRLKQSEQAAVITGLGGLHSPRLLPLAKSALEDKYDPVFNAAVQGLADEGDAGAVKALGAALQREQKSARVTKLAKVLASIGTQDARRVLESVRQASANDKRETIDEQLVALRRRSPGSQHWSYASRAALSEEDAVAITHFSLSLERDPEYVDSYTGRAHSWLKLEGLSDVRLTLTIGLTPFGWPITFDPRALAEQDFRRATELEPSNGIAVTGLAITRAMSGRIDEAIDLIEAERDMFKDDQLFAYNAACAYGRALIHYSDRPRHPSIRSREQLRTAALSELERSVKLGFNQFDWMSRDPDLKALHGTDRFETLIAPANKEPADIRP